MTQTVRVAIGLGSNKGDRLQYLSSAFERLRLDLIPDAVCSSIFETPAWGGVATHEFMNAVVVGTCDWKPPAILNLLKTIEKDLGRTSSVRYGDREIDLDLLAHGEGSWNENGLQVPHPGLEQRQFVLAPFVDIWPDWRHPRSKKSSRDLLNALLVREPARFRKVRPGVS